MISLLIFERISSHHACIHVVFDHFQSYGIIWNRMKGTFAKEISLLVPIIISFPGLSNAQRRCVFLAFLNAIKQQAASGERPSREKRGRRGKGKRKGKRKPLPIPFPFLFLICTISTEFRAWRISGTKTDYS